MHGPKKNPGVHPFKSFLEVQEEKSDGAIIQAFTFGGSSEVM
jgi:hypothetical protein